MPPDDKQRIEIEIALKDMMSAGLKQMGADLDALAKKASEVGGVGGNAFNQFTRNARETTETARRTNSVFGEMGGIVTNLSKSFLGPIGVVAGVVAASKALGEFAEQRTALRAFSTDVGFTTNNIRSMRFALSDMGLGAGEADKHIAAVGAKLKDMQTYRFNSELWQGLTRMGGEWAKVANDLLENVDRGDFDKAQKLLLEKYQTMGERARAVFAKDLGMPQSVIEGLIRYQREVENTIGDAAAERYVKNSSRMKTAISELWEGAAGTILERGFAINDHPEKLGDTMFAPLRKSLGLGQKKASPFPPVSGPESSGDHWFDRLKMFGRAEGGPVTAGQPYLVGERGPEMFTPNASGSIMSRERMLASNAEGDLSRTQDDSNKMLHDVRDILQRMETGTERGGGGGSRAGGIGARNISGGGGGGGGGSAGGGGGGLRASLGGFRSGGGVNSGAVAQQLASSLKAAGMPDSGIAAVMGTVQQESGFNPLNSNSVGTGHKGLFQWEPSRAPSSWDVPSQSSHFLAEMQKTDPAGYAVLMNPKSTPDETMGVMNHYERFKGWQQGRGGAEAGARYSYADQYRARLHDGVLSGAGGDGSGGGNATGLNSVFKERLDALTAAAAKDGIKIGLGSGFRTHEEQARLYAQKPGLAAPPGHSLHELGLAGDLTFGPGGQEYAHEHAREHGLRFPMSYEPWHIQPVEGRSLAAAREQIDRSQAASTISNGKLGSVSASVDFKNVPSWVKTSVDSDGAFRDLRVSRTPQAAKSGGAAAGYSSWNE